MKKRRASRKLAELGGRIREMRVRAGLSQETVAELAGVSANTVIRIEAGRMAMSIETFMRMVEILETDARSLLGGDASDVGRDSRFQDMLRDIMRLNWREREAVMRAVEKMLDGLDRCQ